MNQPLNGHSRADWHMGCPSLSPYTVYDCKYRPFLFLRWGFAEVNLFIKKDLTVALCYHRTRSWMDMVALLRTDGVVSLSPSTQNTKCGCARACLCRLRTSFNRDISIESTACTRYLFLKRKLHKHTQFTTYTLHSHISFFITNLFPKETKYHPIHLTYITLAQERGRRGRKNPLGRQGNRCYETFGS